MTPAQTEAFELLREVARQAGAVLLETSPRRRYGICAYVNRNSLEH